MVGTHSGGKFFVCATPQAQDLTEDAYAALAWVQVRGVGSFGETGTSTNILTYDMWDTDVVAKGKGLSNAGDPVLEVARIPSDPGQSVLRAAALTNFNYAIKTVMVDDTIRYDRGLVTGPTVPLGRNEDFDLEVFTFALQQRQAVSTTYPPGWLGLDGLPLGLDGLILGLGA